MEDASTLYRSDVVEEFPILLNWKEVWSGSGVLHYDYSKRKVRIYTLHCWEGTVRGFYTEVKKGVEE